MEPQPRSNPSRVVRMVVLVVVATSVAAAVDLIDVTVRVKGHTFGDNGELGWVVLVAVWAVLATRVSLPWYYAAWMLVPFVGLYAFWKVSWRAAYLPWRDWGLREGEVRGPYDVAHDLYGTRERMVHVRRD